MSGSGEKLIAAARDTEFQAAARDAAFILQHLTRRQIVRNALDTGLTAQDVLEGVKLSHAEYLDLVHRAIRMTDS